MRLASISDGPRIESTCQIDEHVDTMLEAFPFYSTLLVAVHLSILLRYPLTTNK